MKRTLIVLSLLAIVSMSALSQWTFSRLFPLAGDTSQVGDIHGLAVSPDGKVWVQKFGTNTRDSILIPDYLLKKTNGTDSILVSRYAAVRALYAYNPNGTQASFSPITVLTIGTKQDTIGGWRLKGSVTNNPGQGLRWDPSNSPNTGRGLRADHQGNILAVYFGQIYRINYATGAGMAKVVVDSANSLIAPGVDSLGNIFINRVVAANQPIKIYDKNFAFIGNARDTISTASSFSRSIQVSRNGNDVYYAGYTVHAVVRYRSASGVLGPYSTIDTVLRGFDTESFEWNPKTRHLWASAGSFADLPNRYPGTTTGYTPGAWYAYNTATNQIVDSIRWQFYTAGNANERPRGIAFSPGGDTAYVGIFASSSPVPGVRMYVRGTTAVERIENKVPANFTLEQNYPNPFNPSTEIRFSMKSTALASLIIYDMLGREVALLVHEQLQPGVYKYRFDASSFPSGTYIYELRVGSEQIAKKMMLLK